MDIGRLSFIGGGNMAAALIAGLVQAGMPAERITVADPSADRRRRLAAEYGVLALADNAAAARDAEIIVLAVKPQHMRAMAAELAPSVAAQTLILSVAAGISHGSLTRWFGADVTVIRTMPNRPAFDGHGATGLYAPASVGPAARARAEAVMGAVGVTVWVDPETQMDTVTGISGSGPAYFFLFIEALEAAGRTRGLPAGVAHRLALETAYGAACMARSTASVESLAQLRDQVTSKGGTTAAALAVFEASGLRDIVARAVAAADARSAELAAEYGDAASDAAGEQP
jgi:pyrroline-5-carboxylate reductase